MDMGRIFFGAMLIGLGLYSLLESRRKFLGDERFLATVASPAGGGVGVVNVLRSLGVLEDGPFYWTLNISLVVLCSVMCFSYRPDCDGNGFTLAPDRWRGDPFFLRVSFFLLDQRSRREPDHVFRTSRKFNRREIFRLGCSLPTSGSCRRWDFQWTAAPAVPRGSMGGPRSYHVAVITESAAAPALAQIVASETSTT